MNELQKMDQGTNVMTFNFFDPTQFETMQRVCKMFANSELVPDMYKVSDKNPIDKATANCMIAISIAMRIGADPLMIMQNMTPIYGRPAWSSKFLIATVNTCGRFNPLAYTTKKGATDILESTPVDVKLAVQEGWYTKNGSKWQTMTRQMLTYRAASMWTNAYAPELSMGMKTVEEMHDIVDAEYIDVTDTVEKEKAENANKGTINIDDAPTATDPAQPEDQPTDQGNNQNQPGNNAPKANGPGF